MPSVTPPASFCALVVDDEKNIRTTLALCLESMGGAVVTVPSAEMALAACRRQIFDLAFVDLRLTDRGGADRSGLDLIPGLLAETPDLAIIIITAYATFDTAVEAIKRGARDYLPKPFTPAQIRHLVEQVLARRALVRRVSELEQQLAEGLPDPELETASPRMRAVFETLTRAAAADVTVLLRGESGTGKSLLARALHARSPRAAGPFVTVNCPTLSGELLASELFGHARGAFTGAVRDQAGRVEAAQGGTLFLDEIGELDPGLQAKLLRFLQEKQFERIGESRTRQADVRLLAATNRDLEGDVAAGRFREDLLYRLNVIEITVPPLRERREDIVPLARRFLFFAAKAAHRPPPELSPAVEEVLVRWPWPGNLRELRNTVERAVILWPSPRIGIEALPERMLTAGGAPERPAVGGDFSLEEIEREHIRRVLERTATLDEAARILGIDHSTLWRKRKKYEP
jgi:NtrC-family two-component system response regulator AlgB